MPETRDFRYGPPGSGRTAPSIWTPPVAVIAAHWGQMADRTPRAGARPLVQISPSVERTQVANASASLLSDMVASRHLEVLPAASTTRAAT